MMKVNHKAVLAAMLLVGMLPVAKCNAQESAETVIRKTREKCQSIKEGHYEVKYKKKFMSSNDTLTSYLSCDFKKLPDDTIFKKAFALTSIRYEMSKFLTKRGVTYTVLFSDRTLPETYRVRGYPTLCLIDREGKLAAFVIASTSSRCS